MGKMWGESQKVAIYVLENAKLLDITDGATHYHADYIDSPRWASLRDKTMQIDTHIFYNKNKKRHL
jgi:spore germination cell wall hydrolase CwlJ-like protein